MADRSKAHPQLLKLFVKPIFFLFTRSFQAIFKKSFCVETQEELLSSVGGGNGQV